MQSKDGTDTLAKDLCKQRTLSDSLLFFLLLDCREARRNRKQVIGKYVVPYVFDINSFSTIFS